MHPDADVVVIDGEPIVEGTSLFVEPTGELAWVTAVDVGRVHVETLDEDLTIPMETFHDRVTDGDYVPGAPPAAHPAVH